VYVGAIPIADATIHVLLGVAMLRGSQVCSVLRTSAIASPLHSAYPKKKVYHTEAVEDNFKERKITSSYKNSVET